nr:hypothetical protein [uncultured Rhodopila sp.]
MNRRSPAVFGVVALAAAMWMLPPGAAFAQAEPAAAQAHAIPQALRIEQKETAEQLTTLASRPAPVGPAAKEALALLQKHYAREREFILPPLTLLPLLADGTVTADMAWALPMVDRVKAEREQIFNEHAEITEALNALLAAAIEANDNDAKEFAESAAGDSLTDLEILEPAILMIGETLRAKLPAAH